jgi:hypothetical protein
MATVWLLAALSEGSLVSLGGKSQGNDAVSVNGRNFFTLYLFLLGPF